MNTSFWSVVKKMRWGSWRYFTNIYIFILCSLAFSLDSEIISRVIGALWGIGALLGLIIHYRETKAKLSKGGKL